MNSKVTALLTLACTTYLTGCFCTKKVILSGNGNVTTGVVGGTIEIEGCTPMEKEVANQLNLLSDWYRVNWEKCGSTADPAGCRSEVSKSYQEQNRTLLDVLKQMKGKPADVQKRLYESVLSTARFEFLQK